MIQCTITWTEDIPIRHSQLLQDGKNLPKHNGNHSWVLWVLLSECFRNIFLSIFCWSNNTSPEKAGHEFPKMQPIKFQKRFSSLLMLGIVSMSYKDLFNWSHNASHSSLHPDVLKIKTIIVEKQNLGKIPFIYYLKI